MWSSCPREEHMDDEPVSFIGSGASANRTIFYGRSRRNNTLRAVNMCEDTRDEVARRQRRLLIFIFLATVTGHSSSGGSRQSIRNPEDTQIRIVLHSRSSRKKHILGNYSHIQRHNTLISCTPVQCRLYRTKKGRARRARLITAHFVLGTWCILRSI